MDGTNEAIVGNVFGDSKLRIAESVRSSPLGSDTWELDSKFCGMVFKMYLGSNCLGNCGNDPFGRVSMANVYHIKVAPPVSP